MKKNSLGKILALDKALGGVDQSDKRTYYFSLPEEVSRVPLTLDRAGFQAYLVGGCVRDLILGRKPKDWDITTDAVPEQIIALFEKTFYENNYGTVGIVNEGSENLDETLKIIEVTPFRIESEYSDNRRPNSVIFSKKLEDDLKRRDFTINAIALRIERGEQGNKGGSKFTCNITDPHGGREDLANKLVRTVGNADERFKEDALRLLRAIRIATELGFTIDTATEKAILANSALLKNISTERIREEFSRILLSKEPMKGIVMAKNMGLLKYIAPELERGIGVTQTQAHSYDVWEHLLRSLQHAADKGWPLDVRLAALFHDIAKPETKRWSEEKKENTFYGHDVVGAKVTRTALTRLKFPKDTVEKVANLVRWHMFFSDTEQISLSAVRRMIVNVGKENIWDLMNVRICDRIGTGRPKENPYRLRKYHSMVEEALRDPISVGMLKINGEVLMKNLNIMPGPKIGFILHALLEEVLENPTLNTEEYLQKKASELALLGDEVLHKMGMQGKEKKALAEQESLEEIRKKHWVK